jgi:hypothetical protein
MSRQHLPRNLRVTGFVGADQPEQCEFPEEEKRRDREQQQPIRDAEAIVH